MRKRKPKLVLGRDYIIDTDGRCVLTHDYLKSLGACCGKDCRYCPYDKISGCPSQDANGRMPASTVIHQN